MKLPPYHASRDSFTLVELLVVIGILAILTAAVVVVLNPAELLKQSRDSKRTTDLANLNNAIKLLLTQNPDVSLGSASTVYVSLADSSSTCGSYSLPALSSGWKYHCSVSADYQKADGSGWMPVSFAAANGVASLSSLPVDPQNSATGGLYYTYVPGGSWALTALMESEKGAKAAISDGGMMPGVLERGTDLSLTPGLRDRGLVGYWPFDEGAGTIAHDASGGSHNGTVAGGSIWRSAASCKKGGCMSFDGNAGSSITGIGDIPDLNTLARDFSISLWFQMSTTTPYRHAIMGATGHSGSYGTVGWKLWNDSGCLGYYICDTTYGNCVRPGTCISNTNWHYAAVSWDASANTAYFYVDGALISTTATPSISLVANSYDVGIGASNSVGEGYNFWGAVDDVRIYNRVLSTDEVQAIYNATK